MSVLTVKFMPRAGIVLRNKLFGSVSDFRNFQGKCLDPCLPCGSCGCFLTLSHKRFGHSVSRVVAGVYVPKKGEFKAKDTLKTLPKETRAKAEMKIKDKERSSGELFKSIMGEIHTTKGRTRIALEGFRLIEEALKFGLTMRYLFLLKSLKFVPPFIQQIIEENEDLEEQRQPNYNYLLDDGCNHTRPEIHRIQLKRMEEWSSVSTPPGIIGIFDKPTDAVTSKVQSVFTLSKVPLTLVLDNVREPNNVGSILRTAAAIGCKVLFSEGSANPWDMKALRSGNGAQFILPLTRNVDLSRFPQYIPLSDLNADKTQPSPLSSESGAHSKTVDEDETATSKSGIGVFLADSGTENDKFGLRIVPYTSINFSSYKSIYLCMGGETSGLSDVLKKSVVDLLSIYPESVKHVSRITIPMYSQIDSLNVANAFGIIGYEIARQCTNNFSEEQLQDWRSK